MFNIPDIQDVRINEINYKWLQLKIFNIPVYKILEDMNIKSVAILKDNVYADMLKIELENYTNNIVLIDEINDDINTDIIIIADYKLYYNYSNKYDNILSIRHIIELLYFLYVDIEKVLKSTHGAKVYIARQMLFDREYETENDIDKITQKFHLNTNFGSNIPDYFRYYFAETNIDYDDMVEICSRTPFITVNGYLIQADYKSKYKNFINGERYTVGQPDNYKNRIFLLGACWSVSYFVEDSSTIASHIQKYMSDSKVISYTGGANNYNLHIYQYDILENDIVVLFDVMPYLPCKKEHLLFNYVTNFLKDKNITYITFDEIFYKNKELLCVDYAHMTHRGYKLAAEYIFNNYLKYEIIEESNYKERKQTLQIHELEGIKEYQQYLLKEKFHTDSQNIGAIVMNCNPFSKGHMYLIEKALEKVDYLYIFIVEENKSFLQFQDRFNIVCENLSDKDNVKILRSGKYIISTTTFPEYFNKENMKYIEVDTSYDMTIFAEQIAPVLNIKYRFAGNEPYCNITRQYNKLMKEVLPKYNIEFIEITRIEIQDDATGELIAISATKIREYLKTNNIPALSKMVTDKTLNYLIKLKNKGII